MNARHSQTEALREIDAVFWTKERPEVLPRRLEDIGSHVGACVSPDRDRTLAPGSDDVRGAVDEPSVVALWSSAQIFQLQDRADLDPEPSSRRRHELEERAFLREPLPEEDEPALEVVADRWQAERGVES